MEVKVTIQDNNTGILYDVSNSLDNFDITFKRRGTATRMSGLFHNTQNINIGKGSKVYVYVDGELFFAGYYFEDNFDRWKDTNFVCYDQLRYLKSNDSFIFKGQTATQVIDYICKYLGLKTGLMENTGYSIPYMIETNRSFLDIIYKALDLTLVTTGNLYIFRDDAGLLTLTQANKIYAHKQLKYGENILDYNYTGTIDQDTYNYVKYVFDEEGEAIGNVKTAREKDIIAKDDNTIKKWGMLQAYEKVNEDFNSAQIQEMAKNTLLYYNRELRTIEFDAIGDKSVKAGTNLYIDMGEEIIAGQQMKGYQLVDEVKHKFENQKHTMHVKTRELTTLSGWTNSWRQ